MRKPVSGKGWELLAGLAILAIYSFDILSFFPNQKGLLGHDWMYFVPSMLDGYYAALADGFFKIHWFTPALCGGVPKFPNPQDPYFSLPQLLFFWGGPLYSIRVTVFLFAAAGFVGTYLLLNNAFRLGKAASLVGATLFLFNGFFAAGMIVGHLTKHSFMLLPLACFFVAKGAVAMNGERPLRMSAPWLTAGAACFAYTVYSGGFIILPLMLLSAVGLGFLAAIFVPDFRLSRFFAAMFVAASFGLALSAHKIAAVSEFLHNFPRDFYPLPLIPRMADLGRLFVHSLFGDAAVLDGSKLFVSYQWGLGLHEFDFGITWVPTVLTALGFVIWLERGCGFTRGRKYALGALAGLALVMAVPLALNFYSHWWQIVLKSTPVIKSSTNNVRWLAAYILLFSAISAICVDYVFKRERTAILAGLFFSATVAATAMFPDRADYKDQPYNPKEATDAYNLAKNSGKPREVRAIAAIVSNGAPFAAMGRNDMLAAGWSSYMCYEPVFGYNLETFPYKTLHLGSVTDSSDGRLNLKNPACMTFPKENGCLPGDQFKIEENEKAAKFIAYKNFDFKVSAGQRAANNISLVAWLVLLAVAAASIFGRKRKSSAIPTVVIQADLIEDSPPFNETNEPKNSDTPGHG